jgi:hypothetical protein
MQRRRGEDGTMLVRKGTSIGECSRIDEHCWQKKNWEANVSFGQMDYLLRGYAALVPTNALRVPSQLPFVQVHDFLLGSILLDPHLQAYPPSKQYQRFFWKWAIDLLESMAVDEACIHRIPVQSASLRLTRAPEGS